MNYYMIMKNYPIGSYIQRKDRSERVVVSREIVEYHTGEEGLVVRYIVTDKYGKTRPGFDYARNLSSHYRVVENEDE